MKVSNPLTIIAIFSGIAETLATVALVQLPLEIQSIFVYFVMAFPAGIVLLFFFVLYFKNTVLYAPSDFEDQKDYLEANNLKEKVNSEIEKIFDQFNSKGISLTREEIDKVKTTVSTTIDKESLPSDAVFILQELEQNQLTTTHVAEALVINRNTALAKLNHLKKLGFIHQNEQDMWQIST
ncbi:MAG: hypothetical protein ACI9LM_000378 [Alteromonadaceae bacterium]|jgi:hypothetical protein